MDKTFQDQASVSSLHPPTPSPVYFIPATLACFPTLRRAKPFLTEGHALLPLPETPFQLILQISD